VKASLPGATVAELSISLELILPECTSSVEIWLPTHHFPAYESGAKFQALRTVGPTMDWARQELWRNYPATRVKFC